MSTLIGHLEGNLYVHTYKSNYIYIYIVKQVNEKENGKDEDVGYYCCNVEKNPLHAHTKNGMYNVD